MTPAILAVLFFTSITAGLEIEIDGYAFPNEIHALGWMITSSTVAMIPLVAVYQGLNSIENLLARVWA